MPLLEGLPLDLDVDAVLRAQGADPQVIRDRHPDLVDIASRALEEGMPLLEPRVLYEQRRVVDVRHSRLKLEGGATLRGELVMEHLASASEIIAILCTVGERIEERAREAFKEDPVVGLAFDGVGSAAVEALSASACRYFELQAAVQGVGVSVPLSPGMDGWSVGEGQPQLFRLLPAEQIGVSLTEGYMMRPAKSLTLVLGIGPDVATKGTICDYCAVRATCRYRGSHPE